MLPYRRSSEDILEDRDWRISDALDKLTPLLETQQLDKEQVEQKALLLGMPPYGMWTAHHLNGVINGFQDACISGEPIQPPEPGD